MTADEANKYIRNACVAGTFSAAVTLVASLLPLIGVKVGSFDIWNLTDAGLIAGLVFGIYKQSRVCAAAMVIYYLISKTALYLETGRVYGVPLAVLFFYFFTQGFRGTIHYHRLNHTPRASVKQVILRIIGGLLIVVGVAFTGAFVNARVSRESGDAFWVDALLWLVIGLVPFCGGGLLVWLARTKQPLPDSERSIP